MKKTDILIFCLFVFLGVLMTMPVAKHMSARLPGGDAMLNAYIIAWDINRILKGGAGFWDTGMFYPDKNTLAYSEHQLGSALLGLPVYVLTKNPAFTYNFLFLLSYVLCGFGMFLLVKHLAGRTGAAVIAGFIYAFAPFKMDHFVHLHVISCQWLAFVLLYMHRFFEEKKAGHLFIMTLFLILQFLSSMHTFLFLSVFLVFLMPYFLIKKKMLYEKNIPLASLLCLVLLVGVLVPFMKPYAELKAGTDFVARRRAQVEFFSPDIRAYLAAPSFNRLYGAVTEKFRKAEGALFTGIIPLVLAIAGIYGKKRDARERQCFLLYSAMLIIAFLLSLGMDIRLKGRVLTAGPYRLLFYLFPGFSGIRAPGRMTVMFLAALSVLCGYGFKNVEEFIKTKKLVNAVSVMVLFGLAAEFYSLPFPNMREVKTQRNLPAVYRWLNRQKDAVMVELPVPGGWKGIFQECEYLYYSAFHFTKTLNGYSGYIPPSYHRTRETASEFPSAHSICHMRNEGVRYMVCHLKNFDTETRSRILDGIREYPGELKTVFRDDDDYVWEIIGGKTGPAPCPERNFLKRDVWKVKSNKNSGAANLAVDSDPDTRWDTAGAQRRGDYFSLDTGKRQKISGIIMKTGDYASDFPRGYTVRISDDGVSWRNAKNARDIVAFGEARIYIQPETARYLNIMLNKNTGVYYWSINELYLF